MDPVFTLPYSEYAIAQRLADMLPAKDGYSIFVPASRQEKGVDLVLVRRNVSGAKVATIQVKASRTYSPKAPKREPRRRAFQYFWFNKFEVHAAADLWMLVGHYPPEHARTRKAASSWWEPVVLCFTANDLRSFVEKVSTKKGTPDRFFAFGFDEPSEVHWTRGHQEVDHPDLSDHLLERCKEMIEGLLN